MNGPTSTLIVNLLRTKSIRREKATYAHLGVVSTILSGPPNANGRIAWVALSAAGEETQPHALPLFGNAQAAQNAKAKR